MKHNTVHIWVPTVGEHDWNKVHMWSLTEMRPERNEEADYDKLLDVKQESLNFIVNATDYLKDFYTTVLPLLAAKLWFIHLTLWFWFSNEWVEFMAVEISFSLNFKNWFYCFCFKNDQNKKTIKNISFLLCSNSKYNCRDIHTTFEVYI